MQHVSLMSITRHTLATCGHSHGNYGHAACVVLGSEVHERFVITSARSTWNSRRSDVVCVERRFAGRVKLRDTSAFVTQNHSSADLGTYM